MHRRLLRPVQALILLLAFLCALTAHAERRVALIIGNAAYAESPLANPLNDARDMRAALLKLGFDKGDIVYRENLKTQEIGALLREWRARLTAGPDTVALVYYAGHGLQIRGENFFPTIDARIDGEEDVPRQAVRLAELLTVMAESRTRMNLVFLDACRNNPYARSFRDGTRGLAREQPPSGTLIAYAAAPNAVAIDGKGRNGAFTAQLLSHIALPGELVELMLKKVSNAVYTTTAGKQEPWQEGTVRGDFYFAKATAPAASVAQAATRVQPGQVIKDCDICPELVLLPRGSFMMGSPEGQPERYASEGPLRKVTIDYDLAVGRFEVTQGRWKSVMGGNPSHFNSCGDVCPVENVSWNDVQDFLKKLNARSGQRYRLLSEAEWEYAARAGAPTPFHTGQAINGRQANFNDDFTYNGDAKGLYREKTVSVGSFKPNAFGLFDMHGNVWEWVQDAWHDNYEHAPTDGSAWESGGVQSRRVRRGGSWHSIPRYLRSAMRYWSTPDDLNNSIGFRLARTF